MTERAQAFHRLHESGCFVIPNPWDVGSARLLESLGFRALASTSAGLAWSLGKPDNGVTLDEILTHLSQLAASVNIPVSADFEGAFAVEPADVAANVARAAATGIAGLSVEDSRKDGAPGLYEFELAVDRIRAARKAIDESGTGIVLTARSEGFVAGRPDMGETIRRLTAYAAAGADCLFAPGIKSEEQIAAVAAAVSPKPINVIAVSTFSVAQHAALGVRRISVGGAFARTALTAFLSAAREIAENGTFSALAQAIAPAEMNGLFRR